MIRNDVRTNPDLPAHLADAGFRRAGGGVYRSRQFSLHLLDGWAVLTPREKDVKGKPVESFAPSKQLAAPWRRARLAGKPAWIAEFPLTSRETTTPVDLDGLEAEQPPLLHFLEWAKQSANKRPPSDWHPPPNHTLQLWSSAGQLTVQAHHHVRLIAIRRTEAELALQVPIVAALPADLPAPRERWLQAVLLETQNQWRMVRIADIRNETQSSVIAEVVLSGAPHAILETLFTVGIQSLAYAVRWSVQSADLLADLGVVCRAWEVHQPAS